LTEDLKTQAAGEKPPAEENAQINNPEENCNTGFGAEVAVEQFTVEEKNNNQVKWETYSDYSSDDEDFTPAAEEKFTQEDKLQYMNIDEVSWAKMKGYVTEEIQCRKCYAV